MLSSENSVSADPARALAELPSRPDWRERLLQALLAGLGTVSLPILVNEVLYRDDWLIPTLGWSLLPTLWLLGRRVPFVWRAGFFLAMILLLGAWAATSAGLMGSGRIFMGASVIVGGLLFGRGVGIALFVAGCLFTSGVGYAAVTGQLLFAPPFDTAANTAALWISHVGTFVIAVGTLLTAVLYVIETLEGLHDDLRREVREREALERAERESARNIRFLAANAGDVFWTMDLDLNLTFVSESVERMHGLTADEVLGMGLAAFSTRSRESLRELIAAGLAREGKADPNRRLRLETRLTTKDGSGVDVEINVGFLRDDDGKPIGVIGVNRDISDRRRLESAMDSVIRGTRRSGDGDFFDALTGNLAEVLDVRIVLIATLADDDRLRCISVYRDGRHVEDEGYALAGTPCEVVLAEGVCNCRSGAGERFPDARSLVASGVESVVGVPLLDAEGQRIGVLMCLDDAPMDQPRLTEDLLTIFSAHASLELSRQHAEEERETIRRQLEQSQKLDSIGQLSGGIAHDFNNLLVVIQGYAELAESSADDPETLEDSLLNIRAATDRAAALTR
ncbi:MAG: PAS domain S-box protein, partial [Pseudomonadales bacterium]|nr:PAS domain S-box protein [Pseudomonadales bacterium]